MQRHGLERGNVCVMSQHSASGNHELLRCGAVIRSAHFDRRDSFHAIEHLTKDDMFAIEVRARHSGDEKLRKHSALPRALSRQHHLRLWSVQDVQK